MIFDMIAKYHLGIFIFLLFWLFKTGYWSMSLISLINENLESGIKVNTERSEKQRNTHSHLPLTSPNPQAERARDPIYDPSYHFLSPPLVVISCLLFIQTSRSLWFTSGYLHSLTPGKLHLSDTNKISQQGFSV